MTRKSLYKVVFLNQAKVYEIYAGAVQASALYGFIEVEQLLFGETTTLVVDPAEEQLKREFEHVSRMHIPLHAVVRIDEVDRQGTGKITAAAEGSNVRHFPAPPRVES